jgi:hypothetical protein
MDSSLDTLYVLAPPFAAKEGGFTWRWFRWLIPNWILGCVLTAHFQFSRPFSQMFHSIWISAKLTLKYATWHLSTDLNLSMHPQPSLFPLNCNGSNFVWKECNKSACVTSELNVSTICRIGMRRLSANPSGLTNRERVFVTGSWTCVEEFIMRCITAKHIRNRWLRPLIWSFFFLLPASFHSRRICFVSTPPVRIGRSKHVF